MPEKIRNIITVNAAQLRPAQRENTEDHFNYGNGMETVKSVLRMGLVLVGMSFLAACGSLVDPFDGDRPVVNLNGHGSIVSEAVGKKGNGEVITLEEDLGRSAKSITLKGARPCPLPLMSQEQQDRVLENAAVAFGKKPEEMRDMLDNGELCIDKVEQGMRVHCGRCEGGNAITVIEDIE